MLESLFQCLRWKACFHALSEIMFLCLYRKACFHVRVKTLACMSCQKACFHVRIENHVLCLCRKSWILCRKASFHVCVLQPVSMYELERLFLCLCRSLFFYKCWKACFNVCAESLFPCLYRKTCLYVCNLKTYFRVHVEKFVSVFISEAVSMSAVRKPISIKLLISTKI